MELFPAADEEQFEFIKTVIDQSDYYIIISAGRYGSIHPETGLSYTEMEYDYAVETGKPVIRLLHKDPLNQLKGSHIEKTDGGKKALEKFRDKLSKGKMVKYWENESELGTAVDHSLRLLIKTKPAVGWVPSNLAISIELLQEIEELRTRESKKSKAANTETVINFGDRKGQSSVRVMAADSSEAEDEKCLEQVDFENSYLAEYIFLSLLTDDRAHNVATEASELASQEFDFPSSAKQYQHRWIDIPRNIVDSCLLYLESRNLVSFRNDSFGTNRWSLTSRGRQHAAFIKASKEFN